MRLDVISGDKKVVEYDFPQHMHNYLLDIVAFYARVRPSDLVKLTHAPGGPWYKAWNHTGHINPGMKIDDSSIIEYYSCVPSPFAVQ